MCEPIVFDVIPSAQEIYDACVGHLARQKKQSAMIMGGTRSCRYRMDDGRACALGVFIEERVYKESMEGSDIYHLVNSYWSLPEWMGDHKSLLDALQQAHDYASCAVQLKRELANIASDYCLDAAATDTITEFVVIGRM